MRRNLSSTNLLLAATLALGVGQVQALTELTDESMSGVTGEGIAFLPENLQVMMSEPDVNQAGALTNRGLDTGYIRLIPVGPLTDVATNDPIYGSYTGKGDVFLYGLGISKADGNSNSRLGDPIASWGTPGNPWLVKVQSESDVQDFSTTNITGNTVSYLNLEAPLYQPGVDGAAGADAYNLKLAWWADIFNRDPGVAENLASTGTQFDVGGAGRANRLRLQAIWDGLSVNGSHVRLFQTQGGATNSGGMSTFYNNTLGAAVLVRMNSGDSTGLIGTFSDSTTENTTYSGWNNVHGGWNSTLNAAASGGNCNNGGATNTAYTNQGSAGCRYIVQNRIRTDSKTRTQTWTPPSMDSVFRFSTRESGAGQGLLNTPAIVGGSAPSFDTDEGLYLYAPNINLPIGSIAQPLIAGVAADGRNITFELTRIPNKAETYTAIYNGGNCNVHQCAPGATHGSITIGSTNYDGVNNLLTAYTGDGAVGVSFGKQVAGSATTMETRSITEVQYKQRRVLDSTWTSAYWCSTNGLTICYNYSSATGHLYQWQTRNSNGTWTTNSTAVNTPGNASCSGRACSSTSAPTGYSCPEKAGCTLWGTNTNRQWNYAVHGQWLTSSSAEVDALIGASNGVTGAPLVGNQASDPSVPATSFSGNLGSVVIDGILIQHMKFTTTGL
ncbi:hypothetical protein [Alcanivorax sediminis]|uniref:Uncharacterized protein n=1 Tax=Alcanivorax sediminis TaxID=2663008 RepID=A0A6N7LUE7_9GAMM|nr:hypothetical protein [Alcanivorax sediminis]MQX54057.1 hypothetical protein [Alcanivorax sediminis]